jgi:drug/metabolite transporter (DMT)-like permease
MVPATFLMAYPYLEKINTPQFTVIFFIAISGTLAQTLLNSALKRGDLSFLLPLDFLKLIWSVIIGSVLFGESAPILLWLGGAFIISAATLLVITKKKS